MLTRLFTDSIELAFLFESKKNYPKAVGLLNFAIAVLRRTYKDRDVKEAIDILNHYAIELIVRFASTVSTAEEKISTLNLNHTIDLFDEKNKQKLSSLRISLQNSFFTVNDDKSLLNFNYRCAESIDSIFIDLINQSLNVIGKPPCQFAFVFLGSQADRHATPYSDFEFMILTEQEDQETHTYFKNVTKLILLQILNLGETTLSCLGLKVWDSFTPKGFSFDSNVPQGSTTPLGQKNSFKLIGTPESLATLGSIKGFHKKFSFPMLLRNSRFLYGSETLFKQFNECLIQDNSINIQSYCAAYTEFNRNLLYSSLKTRDKSDKITHKNFFYTPLKSLLTILFFYGGLNKGSYHERITLLLERGILTSSQSKQLHSALNKSLHIRLQQHFMHRSGTIDLSRNTEEYQTALEVMTTARYFYDAIYQQKMKYDFYHMKASSTFFRCMPNQFINSSSQENNKLDSVQSLAKLIR